MYCLVIAVVKCQPIYVPITYVIKPCTGSLKVLHVLPKALKYIINYILLSIYCVDSDRI